MGLLDQLGYESASQAYRQGLLNTKDEWQPDNKRAGGHALEPPLLSPDDLIGTGIPAKLAMLIKASAVAAAPAATAPDAAAAPATPAAAAPPVATTAATAPTATTAVPVLVNPDAWVSNLEWSSVCGIRVVLFGSSAAK
jgi:hypothetical protein